MGWRSGNTGGGGGGGGGGGSALTSFGADLLGSSATQQWVDSISGSGGGGGTVPLNIGTLQWASATTAPTMSQAQNTSGAGVNMLFQAQAAKTGSAAAGGNLELQGGAPDGVGAVGSILLLSCLTGHAFAGFSEAAGGNGVLALTSTAGGPLKAALISDGTNLEINATSSGGIAKFHVNGSPTGVAVGAHGLTGDLVSTASLAWVQQTAVNIGAGGSFSINKGTGPVFGVTGDITATSNATLHLPDDYGFWMISLSCTLGANTLTIQVGASSIVITAAILTALEVLPTSPVIFIWTFGGGSLFAR